MAIVAQLPKKFFLAAVVALAVFTSAGAQGPLVFEPGFEGEIWQTLPPAGKIVGPACLTTQWVTEEEYEDEQGNIVIVPVDPPYLDYFLTCSPTAVPYDEMLFPNDVATWQAPGNVIDPQSGLPVGYRFYVTDGWNQRVLVFGPDDTNTPADPDNNPDPIVVPGAMWNGETPLGPEELTLGWGVDGIDVDDSGNVWVSDYSNQRVVVFDEAGQYLASFPVTVQGRGAYTYGIDVAPGTSFGDPNGRVTVVAIEFAAANATVVAVFDGNGSAVGEISSLSSSADGEFWDSTGVAYHVDQAGVMRLAVADPNNSRIQVFNLNANGVPVQPPALIFGPDPVGGFPQSELQDPFQLSVDGRGRFLISDTENQRLAVFRPHFPGEPGYAEATASVDYLFQLNAQGGLDGYPRGVLEDGAGRLLVVDLDNHDVKVFSVPDLAVVQVVATPGTTQVGATATVEFSVVVPETKFDVVDVMPTCSATEGAATVVLTPVVVPPTPDTEPAGGVTIETLQVFRYACTTTATAEGEILFTVGAVGNGGVTVAPDKTARVLVSAAGAETGPPVISASVTSPLPPGQPVNGFYNQDVTINLLADDTVNGADNTGIKTIYWRWTGTMQNLDPAPQCPGEAIGVKCVTFADPYALTNSVDVVATSAGFSTVEFRTVDGAGNLSTTGSLTVRIDDEPPAILLSAPWSNGWWNEDTTIDVSFADDQTDVPNLTVTLNGSPTSPDVLSAEGIFVNQEGDFRTSTVTATDLAGNLTTTVTQPYRLDKTPPVSDPPSMPEGFGPRTVTLSATDTLSGIYQIWYGVNGNFQQPYTGPFVVSQPGVNTIQYWALDAANNREIQQEIEVIINTPPVADDETLSTPEDVGLTINAGILLDGDTDLDGNTLVVESVGNAVNGTVAIVAGQIVFTPAPGFHGEASFTYTVSDGLGGTDTGTVTVNVLSVNDVPVAVDDAASTLEDTAVVVPVKANDTDGDNDPLAVSLVLLPVNGTALVNPDGTVTYTPNPNYAGPGPDVFRYRITDPSGASAEATVRVTVIAVNDPPVAGADAGTTPEDTAIDFTPAFLLGNDSDVDGDTLSITAVGNASGGTVALVAGVYRFTPAPDYSGPASFTYTVSDGHGGTATATVSITVTAVNDPPAAVNDTRTVVEGSTTVIDVVANDLDPDSALTLQSVTQPVPGTGTALINLAGTITYIAPAPFTGTATFTYTVTDGTATSTATVTITVLASNQPPVCTGVASPAEIWPPNHKKHYEVRVLGVTDPDGDPVTITITAILQDEPVDTTGDGEFSPDASGVGTSTAWVRAERMGGGNGRVYEIRYTATDSKGASCTGTVYTTVPKSQGQPWQTIDSGVRYDSTGYVPGTIDKDQTHTNHTPNRNEDRDNNGIDDWDENHGVNDGHNGHDHGHSEDSSCGQSFKGSSYGNNGWYSGSSKTISKNDSKSGAKSTKSGWMR